MSELITNIESATPEQQFAAGMIASAVQEARLGDPEAYRWLKLCAPAWLAVITPENVDLETTHETLLATAAPQRPWQGRLFDEEAA